MENEKRVGVVEHFYPKVNAASVHIESGSLRKGDTIHFKGPRGEFEARISSMELDREPIEIAREGQDVGIEVPVPIEEGAEVLLVHDPYENAQADLLGAMFGE